MKARWPQQQVDLVNVRTWAQQFLDELFTDEPGRTSHQHAATCVPRTDVCRSAARWHPTHRQTDNRCASGCVVECRIFNREVAGSNLGRGYVAPRSTQPSIPLGSVNQFWLQLRMSRQDWYTSFRLRMNVWVSRSFENTCRNRASAVVFTIYTERRYIKCMYLYLYLLPL